MSSYSRQIKILSVVVLGYGITFYYRRARKDHNPKSKNYDSDGSVKKFRLYYDFSEWNDWQITARLFYNHSFQIRLNMNR